MISKRHARFAVQALTLAGLSLSLPACATITRGTTQQFTVESSPPGARAATSNGFQCDATPCTFRMPRKDAFKVTISRDGYVTQEHQIASGVSGGGATGMAGNLIFGGVVGGVVDATSGAMNDLTPNPLVVTLEPVGAAKPVAAASQAQP
ncbi:MAG: translation initiation factor 2 [Candidatus Brevundimonas phytovorans]|nr:translation initiation factor 2 [Brevundimonas sp.]WEK58030.1 MAG: translation initiation factor 2 [Brevundimonas sp.]